VSGEDGRSSGARSEVSDRLEGEWTTVLPFQVTVYVLLVKSTAPIPSMWPVTPAV